MDGTALTISFAAGAFLGLVLAAVGAVYFRRKSSEERQMAAKRMQDLIDKASKGTDDLNEPARWVP
jgi:hypothetical protein